MHILLAEARQTSRVYLASHIRSLGHTVSEAANGQEALNALTVNMFDPLADTITMVIIERDLPIMDGLEMVRRARELRESAALYIILLAKGKDYRYLLGSFPSHGFDDCLRKPVQIDELELRIRVGGRIVHAERSLREMHSLQDTSQAVFSRKIAMI
jgi:DNA-binding response OmpR family regulator